MEKDELTKLSKEELQKKIRGLKGFIGFMFVAAAIMVFFVVRETLDGGELDMAILTIAICSVGGGISLFPKLKEIQTEIESRKNP